MDNGIPIIYYVVMSLIAMTACCAVYAWRRGIRCGKPWERCRGWFSRHRRNKRTHDVLVQHEDDGEMNDHDNGDIVVYSAE
jgi:hypothetical protein